MSTQIETLKKRLSLGSLPESAKAAIRKQIEQLEAAEKGMEESETKQEEKLEKEEESKEAEVDDKIEKLKKRLTLGSLPESAKAAIRKQIEDAEKLKTEAKKERAEEKKEAQEKKKEVKAKVEKAVKEVEKVVKEAPKKIEKAPATEKKAVEKRVEKEVKQKVEKAKTEAKKAKVEAKKADAKKSEGAKKRKKKFDKMLSDLQRFINKDKKLKALYGSDSKEDLKRDAGRMAKPFGWRYKGEHNYKVPPKSERGNDNTYYEGRPEKADLRRRTYPYLEMGGDVMAKGGDVGKVQMYYHKTSGGAEYLCSEKVAGTKEGSMKAKYVVRIDGAKNGSEMIIKPSFKNVPMYYHKTSGGAEYLCSEKVAGTNEGSMKAKFVCRIDGAKNGSEMGILEEYADGGMMAQGGRLNVSILEALNGYNNGLTLNSIAENLGLSNYRFGKYASESQMKSIKKGLEENIKSGYVEEGGIGYVITEKGSRHLDTIPYEKREDGGMMDKAEYKVVGWMSEEDRNMGESEGLGMYDSLEEAKRKADVAFYRQGYAAVEVLRLSQQGDEDDEVVYFLEEGSEEFAKGGKVRKGKFQAMFYTNEEDGSHIDSEYFNEYPSSEDIEFIANSLNSKYVEIYEDRHKDDSYDSLEETYFMANGGMMAKGGLFGNSRYNTGLSWHLDHARHNKKEDYEVPMANRKGAKKTASSSAKRAKTGKYSKSSRAASSSSSSRGYDYIPNAKIKSITTTDGKVIASKKILDGAYVKFAKGGKLKSPNYNYELFSKSFTKDEQESILYALRGNSRKKMFGGKPYYWLTTSDMSYFTKNQKDEMVEKLKNVGFTVRTVDASGYPDKGQKYTIWIQFDSMA